MFTVSPTQQVNPEIVKEAIKFNEKERARFKMLEDYYVGEHIILQRKKKLLQSNNKVVINHAKYITDINVGYLLGNPVEYQADQILDPVLEQYKQQTMADLDVEIAKDASIFGKQYELVYATEDNEVRSKDIDVRNCIVVYDDTVAHNKMFAVTYELGDKKDTYNKVVVYDKLFIYDYVVGNKIAEKSITQHFFGLVPIAVYLNNTEEMGDFEQQIPLIDAYNTVLSDQVNDKEQLVSAILAFYGVDLTPEQKDDLYEYRTIAGIPADAKIEYIAKQLNEQDADTLRVLMLRKIQRSIRDSIWTHFLDVLDQFQFRQYCKIDKTNFEIILPNNAQFLFRGLDDPEKIKSIKGISDIFEEEATEFTEEDDTQLGLRLRDREQKEKQMFRSFNPISKKNWVHRVFFEQPTTAKLRWSTYKDNHFLDQDTINYLESLKNRNPAYYRIYALGEFATLDRIIFTNTTKRIIRDEEVKDLPQFHGLDFGYVNDPSALVVLRYDEKNKKIFIMREYVKGGMLNDEIARTIEELALQKEIINADSSEQKSIQEIKNLGVSRIRPVGKGKDSVLQGIQWLLQNEIIVDERCFKVWEEFENYTWKKDKNGEYTNDPVDSYNHTIDAIRYALVDYILTRGKPVVRKDIYF